MFDETDGNNEKQLAGPINLVADQIHVGKYYAVFDNMDFVLPAYYQQLFNWQKSLELKGQINGVFTGSMVSVEINPSKDIVGTGMKSGQKISPTAKLMQTGILAY